MTRVLERLGHSVVFPREQTCCGQMHYNTGYHREAVPLVRRFVQMFREAECVCVPSASCVAMMREHYELIAKHENDAALLADVRALLPRVFEFSELLTERLKMEDVGAIFAHSVTYHPSCHSLRMLNIREGPLKLLRAVRGLELRDLPEKEQCCGFGGTFAVKNADVSAAMLEAKEVCVLQTGAEVVAALDFGVGGHLAHVRGVVLAMVLKVGEQDAVAQEDAVVVRMPQPAMVVSTVGQTAA